MDHCDGFVIINTDLSFGGRQLIVTIMSGLAVNLWSTRDHCNSIYVGEVIFIFQCACKLETKLSRFET